MSFNSKKDDNKDQLEKDNMNIKSHLNASLDISGISVSEDLINRTLEAIKKQQTGQQAQVIEDDRINKEDKFNKDDTKKVIPWNKYIRRFAGAAAAILIIAAGYNVISHTGLSKKSMENSTNSSAPEDNLGTDLSIMSDQAEKSELSAPQSEAGSTSGDSAAAGVNGDEQTTSDGGKAAESAPQFTITADTFAAENPKEDTSVSNNSAASTNNSETSVQTDNTAADTANSKKASITATTGIPGDARIKSSAAVTGSTGNEAVGNAVLAFRDIFLPDPNQAECLKITNNMDNTEITLTKPEDIESFYSVMDLQQFSLGTDTDLGLNYTVEVMTPEPGVTTYTMLVGDYIIIDSNDGQTASHSVYQAVDVALLKTNLDDFFQEYYK